jgi:hypothetical protein
MTCVLNDRFHEKGTALAAVPQQPEPEIGSLAGSSDCSPNTSDQREVHENYRIRSLKPNFDSVIWSQVTIDDPPIFFDEPLQQLDPLIARCRGKA